MSALLPIGLTYALAANASLTLTTAELSSASGKYGPLVLKISNPSSGNPAYVGYSGPFTPPTPPTPTDYQYQYDQTNFEGLNLRTKLKITVLPGVSASAVNGDFNNPSYYWQVGMTLVVPGDVIGGTSPENDITFEVTEISDQPHPQSPGAYAYVSGIIPPAIPGPPPIPQAPTEGNPGSVVAIQPLTTEIIQIPSGLQSPDYEPVVITASGNQVFVTPVQIIN